MKKTEIKYDTFPIGYKGDFVFLPDSISELLSTKYRLFSLINKIENTDQKKIDEYLFIPSKTDHGLDFSIVRRNR